MKEERNAMLVMLLKHITEYPVKEQPDDYTPATDEEVREFIRIFMKPAGRYNYTTSYGLKGAAERAIGHIFHGSHAYSYVSNEQFKRIMNESEFKFWFRPKPEAEDSPNDRYMFRWAKGAEDLFHSLGVYGSASFLTLR